MKSRSVTKDSEWSWIVSVGAFVALMLETGMVKCLGVLLPELREQFSTNTWVIGLAISLSPGFGAITCIMAMAVSKVTSSRMTVMLFGSLSSIGLIMVSLSTSLPLLITALSLTSFSYGAEGIAFAILPDYFDKYYDVSNSIGHTGMAVGVMLLPLLTQFLQFLYGWSGCVLILGAINTHIVVSGVLIRPIKYLNPTDSTSIDVTRNLVEKTEEHKQQKISNNSETVLQKLRNIFDVHLLFNHDLMCVVFINTALGYYYTGWLIYLVPHAEDLGMTPYAATTLATFGGVGNLIGSITFSLTAQKVPNKVIIYTSSIIVFVSLAIDPVLSVTRSYSGFALASFTMNVGEALAGCSVFKEAYYAVDHVSFISATNLMFCGYSIGSVCSGFWSGWLFDVFGHYTISFLFLSVVPLLSIIPMAIRDCTGTMEGYKEL